MLDRAVNVGANIAPPSTSALVPWVAASSLARNTAPVAARNASPAPATGRPPPTPPGFWDEPALRTAERPAHGPGDRCRPAATSPTSHRCGKPVRSPGRRRELGAFESAAPEQADSACALRLLSRSVASPPRTRPRHPPCRLPPRLRAQLSRQARCLRDSHLRSGFHTSPDRAVLSRSRVLGLTGWCRSSRSESSGSASGWGRNRR